MDGAVLPDLKRRQVEPERRELPAQLRDLSPGDPLETVVDEGVLDLAQLQVECLGVRIGPGPRTGLPVTTARVRRSRSAMNPNRCRYGSSGKRRRNCRSVSASSSASRASRVASDFATRSCAAVIDTVCMSRDATAS
jgi:hypothetical protein